MQIRQSKIIGIIDKNSVGIWYIQTRFYNRSCHQNIKFAVHKSQHQLFEFFAFHLSVADSNASIWHQPLNHSGHFLDVFYSIINKKSLSVSLNFIRNRIPNQLFGKTNHIGFDRISVWRWRGDYR